MNSGALIYTGVTLDAPVVHRLDAGTVAVYVQQAPYKQDNNEDNNQDAAAVLPVGDNAVVLAVADGMGGAPAGDVAARLAIESLARSLKGVNADDLRGAILDGIEKANKAIIEYSSRHKGSKAYQKLAMELLEKEGDHA